VELDELVKKHPQLSTQSVLLAYRGSHSHGMYVPPTEPTSVDDIDLMSVFIPGIEEYFGLSKFEGDRGTVEIKAEPWDVVAYELRKFIFLLRKGNPNVVSMLWLDEKHYVSLSPIGQKLIANRALFSTKEVYHSFVHYARAQLYKMTHLAFKGYMGEKRKRLVEKFGYDTKNAAHLIRLMRMAIEFLEDGRFRVVRPDAAELLEIKRGEWRLAHVQSHAEELFRRASDAFEKSTLPEKPNNELIDQVLVSILREKFIADEAEFLLSRRCLNGN
jgi:predicted nucleotidyltransferase